MCNRLQIIDGAVKLYKGTNPEMDSYSAFFDNIRSSGSTGTGQCMLDFVTSVEIT